MAQTLFKDATTALVIKLEHGPENQIRLVMSPLDDGTHHPKWDIHSNRDKLDLFQALSRQFGDSNITKENVTKQDVSLLIDADSDELVKTVKAFIAEREVVPQKPHMYQIHPVLLQDATREMHVQIKSAGPNVRIELMPSGDGSDEMVWTEKGNNEKGTLLAKLQEQFGKKNVLLMSRPEALTMALIVKPQTEKPSPHHADDVLQCVEDFIAKRETSPQAPPTPPYLQALLSKSAPPGTDTATVIGAIIDNKSGFYPDTDDKVEAILELMHKQSKTPGRSRTGPIEPSKN